MIKKNTNNEKMKIKILVEEQQKDQNSNTVYPQKVNTPPLDRWNDITVGQLKKLIEDNELTFDELIAFLFIDVFKYSINYLSRNLRRTATSRRAVAEKYESAVIIIKKIFKNGLKKVYVKNHNKPSTEEQESVSDEVREVFDEWDEYSKDYSNFVDNRYRQRHEYREKKYDI